MSDICAKNLGHGHAFNRPFGNTYKCQWCGVLQSDIAEVESLRQRIAKQDGLIATKNADISSWVERDFTNQRTIATLKEQHNSLLDVYRQNMQLVSELQEQNALLTVQVQRLETAIAPLAGCHLPPDGCEHLGVTAHFYTGEVVAAKAALTALIPQDGRTALEKFGMKVATETRSAVLINTREDLFTEDSSLRAIVTNLIGADLPEADKEKS